MPAFSNSRLLRSGTPLTCLLLVGTALAQATETGKAGRDPLAAEVEALVAKHGNGVQAAVWLADRDGRVLFARDAEALRPTASAIKVPLLVELLARCADKPAPKLTRSAQIVDSVAHPAMKPFPAPAHAEIQTRLRNADVDTAAATMIRGDGVANATYNAAANLVIAELGGPQGADQALAARWPGAPEIRVRRYMLAPRDEFGDNEASARALGKVWLALLRQEIPGADQALATRARAVLAVAPDAKYGAHFCKHGALDSLPLARVLSGAYERGERGLVYVVMLSQPALPEGTTPADEGKRLEQTAAAIRDLLLEKLARRALWREV